jgi:hypothetical protein
MINDTRGIYDFTRGEKFSRNLTPEHSLFRCVLGSAIIFLAPNLRDSISIEGSSDNIFPYSVRLILSILDPLWSSRTPSRVLRADTS